MGVKCADCNRPLLKPALQLESRHGPLRFGPVCAKRYIVRPTRTAWKVADRKAPPPPEIDPRQLALEFAC